MSYTRATCILPPELLEMIQNHVDGEYIYIPRKSSNKKEWGSNTSTRKELDHRDREIYQDYQYGYDSGYLSRKYFLSIKSIQRIIRQKKSQGV